MEEAISPSIEQETEDIEEDTKNELNSDDEPMPLLTETEVTSID